MADDPQNDPQQPALPLGGEEPDEFEPVGGFDAYEPGDGDAPPEGEDARAYTTAEFHNVIQKHVIGAAYEMMIESKLPWDVTEPFLRASRDMFRGDFERSGRIAIHGVAAPDGEIWVEAEEAYLSLSVADQDDGQEWLSESWWLSDLILAEEDPARVREAARALERTVAKLDAWLAERDAQDVKAKGPDDA